MPPAWMSMVRHCSPLNTPSALNAFPRYLSAIAEHSMCQPGNPIPQGEGHSISLLGCFSLSALTCPPLPSCENVPYREGAPSSLWASLFPLTGVGRRVCVFDLR